MDDENQSSTSDANVVMQLTASGVVIGQEENSQWVEAYQNDPRLKKAFRELQRGQSFGDLQLNSLGFITIVKGGQHKLVILKSLQ